MSDRWYYQLLLEEFGPVSTEHVLELLTNGTLGDGDLVRSEAGGDWMLISVMKETCQASQADESMLEEIQDLSELNFKFENSGSVTSHSNASGIQKPSPQTQSRVVAKSSATATGRPAVIRADAPARKSVAAAVKASEKPASRQQKSAVPKEKRRRVVGAKETTDVSRSKRISSNGAALEDELPDDVFNDVFQKEDTSSQKSQPATASMSTSPTSAGFAGTTASTGAIATPRSITSPGHYSPASHLSSTQASALYSASFAMPMAPPRMTYTPPVKKRVSVSEPMDFKKIGMTGGAVTAIAGVLAIAIFGVPFGSAPPEAQFDPKSAATVLNYIMRDFDTVVVQTPDEAIWEECVYTAKSQLNAILAGSNDTASDAPEAIACREATKALMQIAELKLDNEEVYTQCKQEFEKHIAMIR